VADWPATTERVAAARREALQRYSPPVYRARILAAVATLITARHS
jgi:hypothetical protein